MTYEKNQKILLADIDGKMFLHNVLLPYNTLKSQESSKKSKDKNESKNLQLFFAEDGLYLSEVNSANVLYMTTYISSDSFDSYNISTGGNDYLPLSVNLDKILTAFSGSDGTVSLELVADKQRLDVTSGVFHYGLGLKKAKDKEPKYPKVPLDDNFSLKAEEYSNIISKCSAFSPYITISVVQNPVDENDFNIKFVSKDTNTNESVTVNIDKYELIDNSGLKEEAKVNIDSQGTGYLNLLKNVLKENIPELEVSLKSNYPVEIKFDIGEDVGYSKILLAPRGSND
ncbi:MAG: hypothetical protein ACOCQD_00340 [archaeon]